MEAQQRSLLHLLKGYWLLGLALALLVSTPNSSQAQARDEADKPSKSTFSLKEAVDFAIENSLDVKNAMLDVKSSQAKVNEIIGIGLPQISGSLNYANTYNVQKVILENDPTTPFFSPFLAPGDVVAFGLQLPNSAIASVQINQLLFDGSWLVGVQASKTYIELAQKSVMASKTKIAENVTKAYYGVLVNRERMGLFDLNINRIDSTLRELKALNAQGLIEKLDVDRLEVTRNNLLTEKSRTLRLVQLAEQLLKFQMGYPQAAKITLTDKLNDATVKGAATLLPADGLDYSGRIEISQLEVNRKLAEFDLKNTLSGYLPKLYGSFTIGSNTAASQFSNLTKSNRWYYYDQLGISLQVPIFDGLMKHYKAQQGKINLMKIENGFRQIKQGIDLQVAQANTNLLNARDAMLTQERNMKLADEVVRVAKVKYRQGVGSNLEVVTAEATLKEAQINYYNAVYDALIAQVDQKVAAGTLFKE